MNFIRRHSRGIILLVLLILILLLPDLAFAADAPNSTWTDMLRRVTSVLSLSIYIVYPMIWVCLVFIGLFMDNEFLFGGGIEEVLLNTWRMIRNLVNIAFVVVLLVIALYNVTGINIGGGDALEFKKALKKFVLAVILVNFSYFGGKVVIDVANVLTTGIFALPADIIKNYGSYNCYREIIGVSAEQFKNASSKQQFYMRETPNPDLQGTVMGYSTKDEDGNEVECQVPTDILIDFQALLDTSNTGKTDWDKVIDIKSTKKFDLKQDLGSNNISYILAEQILNLRKIPESGVLAIDSSKNISALLQIFLKGAFGMIFMLMYGFGFLIVAITLLGRAVFIWAFMCLSPVIALATALEGFAGIQSEIGGLGIKKFVDYAFIPVKVALVTTLGFLLIYQFNKITREDQVIDEQTVQQSSSESTILQTGDQVVDEQRAQQEQAEGGEKNTWALAESSEINLSGQYSSMRVMVKTAGVFSNFNDVRQIAFHLIIVVVLYKGIEWATKDTMTSAFTNRIWGAVKDWGTYIGKAPLHATTIPYYAGEGDEKGVSLFDAYETFLNPHQFEANQKAKKQQDQKVPLNERIQNIKNFNDANQLVKENPYQFLHSKDEGANRDKFAKELITRYEKGFTESGMSVTDINKLKALDYAHNDQGQMVALLAAVAALSNGQNVSDEYKKGAADLIETMNGNVKKEDIETWYNGKASQVNAEEERTKAIQADIKDKHNDLTIGNKEHFKDTFFQVAEGKGLEGMTADQKKDEANKIVQAIDNLGAELSDAEITALNKIAEGDVKKVVPTLEMMKTMLDSSKAGDKLSGPAYDNAKTVFTAAHEASAGASHIQNTVAKTEIEMTRAETACQQQGAKAIEEDDGSGKKIKKIEYKNKDGVTIKVVLPAGKKTEADGDHLKLVDEAPAATGGS